MKYVFVVIKEDCYDCENDLTVAKVFTNKSKAEAYIKEQAKDTLSEYQKDYGEEEVAEDNDNVELNEARFLYRWNGMSFSIWEDGRYCENHTVIYFVAKEVE